MLAAQGHPTPEAPMGGWMLTAEGSYRQARHLCNGAGVLRVERRWLTMLIAVDGGEILRPLLDLLAS